MNRLPDSAVTRLRAQLAAPAVIADRYEVRAEIGRGGMGTVHRALDRVLDREVAVKLLSVEAPSDNYGALLKKESTLLARLEHPGIVPVHDAGVLDDGRVFYVMRLVDGTRLDDFLRSGATRGERLRVLLRVAEAVAFAHSRFVLHCDLKPSNVMIGPHGEVLVLDWGIAQILRSATEPAIAAAPRAGVGAGTPGYMAPEQVAGEPVLSVGVDVYALGRLLEDALRGGDADRPLRSIIAKATAPRPADRYDSATAFAADVRAWLDGGHVRAHRESPWERARRFLRRHQTAVLLLLTYVVVRLFILVWRGI